MWMDAISFIILVTFVKDAVAGWIDIDTPEELRTTKSLIDGSTYHLVMSDEFDVPNRSFKDGSDPMWTALDKSDDDANAAGGGSLHFYNSSTISTTEDGKLQIRTGIKSTDWNHYNTQKKEWVKVKKNFVSGMLQGWNKFCFTGGIVEIDLTLPGEPEIGGLWPAVWMLGNMGRATYEATTNNIWPYSFDECDRKLQSAQKISKCNSQNHFGMHSGQGRGATEIDILEVMAGEPGDLANTVPPISIPYASMTLQVAPGVTTSRPRVGFQPVLESEFSNFGHTEYLADNWYDTESYGNTSINPYFYGTYLGVTKPEEPVQRSKHETFQADAVGALHQLTDSHFSRSHSFRLEWQPGNGGRIDWFVKAYKKHGTMDDSIEGDGLGTEWVKAFSIKDEALKKTRGTQIPAEPSYFILNTAISSTWGFPQKKPDFCKPCYDCRLSECRCNFNPGFCQMVLNGVNFEIDFVRVYQSTDPNAHPGNNHTVGCDPVEYPTKEWIKGHSYLYSRPAPFGYSDTGPLKKIQSGGAACNDDNDCGKQRGSCVPASLHDYAKSATSKHTIAGTVCKCASGFTGPNCLAIDHSDDEPGAYEMSTKTFTSPPNTVYVPNFLWYVVIGLIGMFLFVMVTSVLTKREGYKDRPRPLLRNRADVYNDLVITGRSV